MTVQRTRELAGDDGAQQHWTDDEVQRALDANDNNDYLAAAELCERQQARAGMDFGKAWADHIASLRRRGGRGVSAL